MGTWKCESYQRPAAEVFNLPPPMLPAADGITMTSSGVMANMMDGRIAGERAVYGRLKVSSFAWKLTYGLRFGYQTYIVNYVA